MGSKLKFVIQCLIVGFWHHPYLFLDNLSSTCDATSNVSITLDVKIVDGGLYFIFFLFIFILLYFSFSFNFLFLEQLGLGVISHAVTSVTT